MSDALTYYEKFPGSIINKSTDSNSYKYWQIFADELNVISGILADIAEINDIATQQGAVLDAIGTIVREKRNGRDDPEYRVYLTIAIIKALSRGTIPELVEVSQLILGDMFIAVNEVWTTASARRYDGTWNFDGDNKFDALMETSGNVEIVVQWCGVAGSFDGSFDESFDGEGDASKNLIIDSYNFILENMHQLKGAGIHARVIKENGPKSYP